MATKLPSYLFYTVFSEMIEKHPYKGKKVTWFLRHIFFHCSIPSSYSSYELFHSSTEHTLSFSLSPLCGAQGGSAQSKVLQEIPERRPGENLHPLSLSPFISLPQPPLLHSSLLAPFTTQLSSFLSLNLALRLVSIPPASELRCKPGHVSHE